MNIKTILLSFLLVVVAESCIFRQSKITEHWSYAGEDERANNPLLDSDSTLSKRLCPVSFIDIQEDGRYTMYISGFDFGKWELKDSLLTLKNNHSEITQLVVKSAEGNKLSARFLKPFNSNKTYLFEGINNRYTKANEYPYAVENNKWRIKSTQPETDKEVYDKVLNHLRYWELYFRWGTEHNLQYLDVRSLSGPLKIYGNGFTLLPLQEESPFWKENFYSEEECQKVYNILKTVFDTEHIAWANQDNKYKMFASAFRQMQEKVARLEPKN